MSRKVPTHFKSIGIIRHWPEQRAAEHETIERFKLSSRILGIPIYEVDLYGKTSEGFEPDILINLHYETPKMSLQPSIHTLWNPRSFVVTHYSGNGVKNTSSNTFLASGFSKKNDLEMCEILGIERDMLLSHLLPSLDAPIMPPKDNGELRLFYAGINWERLKGHGRYSTLLKNLDDFGFLDIYGPHRMFNKVVWEGFQSYRGEIPFDGKTLISKANDSGVYLCLSSEAHVDSELLSNRIFEACAAGTIIIANKHPTAEELFGDSIYWIQSTDENEMADEIRQFMIDIRARSEHARKKARKAQFIFKNKLLLSNSLAIVLKEASDKYHAYLSTYSSSVNYLDSHLFPSSDWIIFDNGAIKPIPYAIGKILKDNISDEPEINLIVGNWITKNRNGDTKLLEFHNVRCGFCGVHAGNAAFLVRRSELHSIYGVQATSLKSFNSAEPIFIHECEKASFRFNSALFNALISSSRINLRIVKGQFYERPRIFIQILTFLDYRLFILGRFIFKKTPLRVFYRAALSFYIWIRFR